MIRIEPMKKRNYAAPIAVAVLLGLNYIAIIALFCLIPGLAWWGKLLLCLIPLAVCCTLIYVLVQRIREIHAGETDDLDKY